MRVMKSPCMLRMTANASSGVRQPCSPERGFTTLTCEGCPPRQWIVSTTWRVVSSTSATMSLTRVRSSCWRARIVTPGASHAAARSSARPAKSGLWPAEQCGQPQCDGAVDVGWPMGHADGDVQVMHPRRRHRSEPVVVPACPEGHCSMGIRPGEHAARAIDVRQASNHGGSFCIGLIWMSVTSAVRGRQRAAMTAAAMSSG